MAPSLPAWPTGLPRRLPCPDVGMDVVLASAAELYGDRPALIDGSRTIGFAEFHEQAMRIAGGLRERGVGPGDIVLLHVPGSLWFPVVYYGILCSGAAAAAVNTAQPAPLLRKQLADCGAVAAFTHPSCADTLLEAGGADLALTVWVPPTEAAPAPGTAVSPLPANAVPLADLLRSEPLSGHTVPPDSLAHLQYTGGTTGAPKGVRVLHRNLAVHTFHGATWRSGYAAALDERGLLRLDPVPGAYENLPMRPGADAVVNVLPMFHATGLVGYSLNVLLGTTFVNSGRFDPPRYLAEVERYRAGTVRGVPTFHHALLRAAAAGSYDLSSVRLVAIGAAPSDTTLHDRIRALYPNAVLTDAYGLSEATLTVTVPPLHKGYQQPAGSVGVPVFDTEIEIRDADRRTALPVGDTGEIWVRGPQIADGYHHAPELTAEQFQDGWLCTGDLGRLDEQGCLYLAGRAKDMIIYKGYNVYPAALEEIICTHPAVAQASVVGEPREEVGEAPVAFVQLRPGFTADPGLADELMDLVAGQVAPYQRVRLLEFVADFPVSPVGKILKSELRKRFSATHSA
ncbi:class I adenylate-forming enzyme family protein [Streptomyces sp. NPDC055078]